MPDPIQVENMFRELGDELGQTTSIRHRFSLIRGFIRSLEGEYKRYDSYLLQLAGFFPVYTSSLTYSGLDPGEIREDLNLFEQVLDKVPELAGSETMMESIQRSREVCAILYTCVGEIGLAAEQAGRRLGFPVKINPGQIDPGGKTNISFEEQSNLNRLIGLLEDIRVQYPDSGEKTGDIIDSLIREIRELMTSGKNSLLIPVVEQYDGLFRDTFTYGRLRRLTMKIDREISGSEDQIIRRYNLAGVEQPARLEDTSVSEAGRALLWAEKSGLSNKRYSGEIYYELSNAVHQGKSDHAAIALMWYTGLQNHAGLRERYEMNPAITVTGQVDGNGNILSVEPSGIRSKAEAAFFSWTPYLVVPESQLTDFRRQVGDLQKRYPNRRMEVLGFSNLRELFYDRRLTQHINPSPVRHGLRSVWNKKFETFGVLIILLLLVVIFRLAYGPLDKEPALNTFTGELLKIKNQSGSVIEEIRVGERTVNRAQTRSGMATFADISGDGINDVIWGEIVTDEMGKQKGYLRSKKVNHDEFLWSVPLSYNFDFPHKPFVMENTFSARKIRTGDFNQDGELNLIVSIDHILYFPGILSMLNPETGEEISHFVNTGRIHDFVLADMNGDGIREVVFCGISNAFDQAFVGILDLDEIEGHSPLTEEYRLNGYELAEHMEYVLMPPTIVGKNVMSHRTYNQAERIDIFEEQQMIRVRVYDYIQYEGSGLQLPATRSYLEYYFNYDLTLRGIGTSDGYDTTAQMLFDRGMIDRIPDFRYFEEYGTELSYWDGEVFN